MNAVKTYHSFYNGVKDLCAISPQIRDIMRKEDKTLPRTHEDATIQVLKSIEKNPPSFRRANPNAHAVNINKNGVSCKLNGQTSFGWTINTYRNNISYVFRFSINSNNKGLYESNEIKKANDLRYSIYDSSFSQKNR